MTLKSGQNVLPMNSDSAAICRTVARGNEPPDRTTVVTPFGGFEEWPDSDLLVQSTWQEGDPCEVCGEDEDFENDPLADWIDANNHQVMAHGQCGVEKGYERA